MRKLKEKEIEFEQKSADYAQSLGGLLEKCVIPGKAGYPDRMGFFPNGHVFFIEFKRKGELPRKLQVKRHKLLRSLGFTVYVCDNLKDAKQIIDNEMEIANGKSKNT